MEKKPTALARTVGSVTQPAAFTLKAHAALVNA